LSGGVFGARHPISPEQRGATIVFDVQRMALLGLRLVLEHLGLYEKAVSDAFQAEAGRHANATMKR
jgi:hypothetical protein